MPVVLVVIIAAAWMVILGPNLVKRRSRAGGLNSISGFHRSLRILERSAPEPIVAPAYRLRTIEGTGPATQGPKYPDVAAVPVLTVVGADKLPRPALAFLGEDPSMPRRPTDPTAPTSPMAAAVSAALAGSDVPRLSATGARLRPVDANLRHQRCRRRRDTLGVLAMMFVGTVMIGFVPGAGAAWMVSGFTGVVLAGYVWLLVHLRRGAEEGERKLRYLDPPAWSVSVPMPGRRAFGGVPVYMSGRYAHPSNQAAAAH